MPGVCPLIVSRLFDFIGYIINVCVIKLLWNKPVQKLVNKARNQYYRRSSLKLIEQQKDVLKKKLENFEAPLLDSRPVISFSPGGTLWAYFIGVIAYLRDHFDIQEAMEKKNLRLCGISCGTSAAITIFFNLSISQAFEFGMEWQKLFDSRILKFCFLDTKQVMDMIIRLFHKFGIDDKSLKHQSAIKSSPLLYFGVTKWNLCPWRFDFELAHSFQTLKELVYGATCSMRTLPFFRRPGKWKKSLTFDGGFSSWFAIPDDAYFSHSKILYQNTKNQSSTPDCIPEIDHVLRVSVIHTPEADISPPETFLWPLRDWCSSGTLEQNIDRFQLGYIHASNIVNLSMLVSKGLRWTFSDDYSTVDLNEWNTHIQQRIEFHAQTIRQFFKDKNPN